MAGQGAADGRGGGRTAYAIRLVADGALVGTSSLMEAHLTNESIHLGSTLYGSRWWGSQVNPEAKLLLLSHCFDDCGFGRVKIQTDALNTRSQAAIAKLGAVREGVLPAGRQAGGRHLPRHRRLQRPGRRMAGGAARHCGPGCRHSVQGPGLSLRSFYDPPPAPEPYPAPGPVDPVVPRPEPALTGGWCSLPHSRA